MSETCATCEGVCVCADLDAFLNVAQSQTITRACRMKLDMFDIGTGRALVDGQKIVNLMVHQPGEYDESDPSMLTMSFGQEPVKKLISLLIRGYEENWGNPNDES